MQPASMEEFERQPLPVFWQARMSPPTFGWHGQATEAEADCLPCAACRGRVDSIACIATYIAQIGADCPDEVLVRIIGSADVTGHDRHNGWPKRRAVGVVGARLGGI